MTLNRIIWSFNSYNYSNAFGHRTVTISKWVVIVCYQQEMPTGLLNWWIMRLIAHWFIKIMARIRLSRRLILRRLWVSWSIIIKGRICWWRRRIFWGPVWGIWLGRIFWALAIGIRGILWFRKMGSSSILILDTFWGISRPNCSSSANVPQWLSLLSTPKSWAGHGQTILLDSNNTALKPSTFFVLTQTW